MQPGRTALRLSGSFSDLTRQVGALSLSSGTRSHQAPVASLVKLLENSVTENVALIETRLKIERLVRDSISQLAGEELLMMLFSIHVLTQIEKPNEALPLIQTLVSVASSFLTGPHLSLYESLYGRLDWLSKLVLQYPCLKEIGPALIEICNQTLIPHGQQGHFTQRASTTAPIFYHPCHFTKGQTRFHDWYALCFNIASLVDEKTLIYAFLQAICKTQKPISSNTLLAMFSILDLLIHGVSDSAWKVLSQADMSFEKWQKTKYFSFFCFKVLLNAPMQTCALDSETSIAYPNILRSISLFAPYCLHDTSHMYTESYFSGSCIVKDETLYASLMKTCHQKLSSLHQKAFTVADFHAHVQACIESLSDDEYVQLSIDAHL